MTFGCLIIFLLKLEVTDSTKYLTELLKKRIAGCMQPVWAEWHRAGSLLPAPADDRGRGAGDRDLAALEP
jgi:hypothetical protein